MRKTSVRSKGYLAFQAPEDAPVYLLPLQADLGTDLPTRSQTQSQRTASENRCRILV